MTVSDPSLSPCASPRAQRVGCKEARSPSCATGEPPIASCGRSGTVRVSGKVEGSRRRTASTRSLAPCGARCPERVGETAARSELHAAGASHGALRARPITVSAAIIALGAPPRALGATTIAARRTRRLARQRRARRKKQRHAPYQRTGPGAQSSLRSAVFGCARNEWPRSPCEIDRWSRQPALPRRNRSLRAPKPASLQRERIRAENHRRACHT